MFYIIPFDRAAAELSLYKTVYVDGQYLDDAVVSGSGLSYPYDRLILGAEGTAGYRYNELDGMLDEVAVYGGILSSGRIFAHYNAITTNYYTEVMADSPLGYWRFEDATSNNGDPVEDWGSLSRDGTYIDSVSLVPGVVGQAARLHGFIEGSGGDCIDIWDGDGAFSLEDITVEVWMNSCNLGSNYPRLFQHNGNWLETYGYGLMCTESLFGVIGANTIDYIAVDINDGQWHHVVTTYETLGEAEPEVSAAELIFKSTGSEHDGDGWNLSSNGYVGTFIDVFTSGPVSVTIKADGSIAGVTLPIMHLHIGDCSKAWNVADNGSPHTTYSDYVADFNLPEGMHAVRIEFVNDYTISGDRNLYIKSVTFDGATIRNSATGANALAAADNYIENCRKGQATVNLIIGEVGSVPEGTEVQVKLRRHAFNFGTEVYGLWDMPWAEPNPTPGSDNYNYQQFIDTHFNMILPGNAGKWAYNESTRDVVTMQAVGDMLDYAEAHGLRSRMHGVLWDYDDQEPDWVNILQNQAITDPCAAAEYWDEIIERIQYFVGEYGGRFTDIDGINESCHRPKNTDIFGIEGVAQLYNEMAGASAGRAKIAVNEYSVLEWTDYTNWYREHIEDIVNAGGTVELIGLQNHTSSGGYNAITVFKNLQLFAGFELPMKITEFSVDTNSSSYVNILTDTMRLAFGNDITDGFIMWGFWKEQIWRDGSALVDENWNLTDMGIAYEQLMAQWDTNEVSYVNTEGRIIFTGYYGDYDIIINGRIYPLTLTKGTTTYELNIPCTSQLQGDIYPDCYVDEFDLQMFAEQWLQDLAEADLNDDNDVDFSDFAIMGNDWRLCDDPTNPECLDK
jgi:GH35 family endo-1,4-beta-xylanase